MRVRCIICLLLVFCSLSLRAQTDSLRLAYSVQGIVTDGETGKAVESALISIPATSSSTVTNSDGKFIIKSSTPFDAVQVSCLGYKTVMCYIGKARPLKVKLTPELLTLEGATIISGDPEDIVRAAVRKIQDNYPSQPELLECFYRETVRKRNRYTYIAEAVARIYKTGYADGVWRDRAAIEKSRVLLSQRLSDTLSVKVQGGPAQAYLLDIVKNREVLLGDDVRHLYTYEMAAPVYIDGRLQFVINFRPGPDDCDFALNYGTFYIDNEDLTFTRIEMSMDVSDQVKAVRRLVVRKPLTLRLSPKEMSIVINYTRKEGFSRLSYFRSTYRFNCDWKKRLFATSYTAINELVVTDVRYPATPIAKEDAFRISDIMNDKAAEFLDPDFWMDYNIIEPSESLEHAVSKLRKGR